MDTSGGITAIARPSCNVLLKADAIWDGNAITGQKTPNVDVHDNAESPGSHYQKIIFGDVVPFFCLSVPPPSQTIDAVKRLITMMMVMMMLMVMMIVLVVMMMRAAMMMMRRDMLIR